MVITDVKSIDRRKFNEQVGFPYQGDAMSYFMDDSFSYGDMPNKKILSICCLVQLGDRILFRLHRLEDDKTMLSFNMKIHDDERIEMTDCNLDMQVFHKGREYSKLPHVFITAIISYLGSYKRDFLSFTIDDFDEETLKQIHVK